MFERDVRDLRLQCQRLSKSNEELKTAANSGRAEVGHFETPFIMCRPLPPGAGLCWRVQQDVLVLWIVFSHQGSGHGVWYTYVCFT